MENPTHCDVTVNVEDLSNHVFLLVSLVTHTQVQTCTNAQCKVVLGEELLGYSIGRQD